MAKTHVSNKLAFDALGNTADMQQSGTEEKQSFLSQKAFPGHSDRLHQASLDGMSARNGSPGKGCSLFRSHI